MAGAGKSEVPIWEGRFVVPPPPLRRARGVSDEDVALTAPAFGLVV